MAGEGREAAWFPQAPPIAGNKCTRRWTEGANAARRRSHGRRRGTLRIAAGYEPDAHCHHQQSFGCRVAEVRCGVNRVV